MLTEFIDGLRKRNLFDDYSKDHLINRAYINEFDHFKNYSCFMEEHNPILNLNTGYECLPQNFLANLSLRLMQFYRIFDEKQADEFLKNQMAAGKDNYDEEQFIRALSEVHVLDYICSYSGEIVDRKYEPRLIAGKNTNPEAMIELKDGLKIAIEVKTPGFKYKDNLNTKNGLFLRPNVVLNKDSLSEYKKKLNRME